MKGRRNNNFKIGFTLLELILVVFIISIITALSTPLFRRTASEIELKNISYSIANLANYASRMSIIERTNYMLNFNYKEGEFWLTRYETIGESPGYKRFGTRYGRTFSVPLGLVLNGDRKEVAFYPDGRSDSATITVTYKTERSSGRTLYIKGLGGRVEISEIKAGY